MALKNDNYFPEIIGSLACLTLGLLSGYSVSAADSLWFTQLNKPFFNPPSWVFAPTWSILYLMMGVVIGKLWKDKIKNQYLIFLFIVQFILNLLWSPIFFYYQNIQGAYIDISALWFVLMTFMISATKQRVIFYLFLPYFLWVSFAWILTFSIHKLN